MEVEEIDRLHKKSLHLADVLLSSEDEVSAIALGLLQCHNAFYVSSFIY